MNPKYVLLALLSPRGQQHLTQGATAVAQPNVNARTVSSFLVPVPPLLEQREIVTRVERLFALSDAIEQRVAGATARADKLMQATLAKAFRGELVPSEAELARQEGREYESAEQLLERLRAAEIPPSRRSAKKAKKARRRPAA